MNPRRLSELAALLRGEWQGAEVVLESVSTDSRNLRAGDLFIALRGSHFDAHDYLAQARERGAAAALVERQIAEPLPQLVVADTRLALGQIAAAVRSEFAIPVLAVTGSNGKTTVKEMLASILGRRGAVLATRGNLNNDIGVPLTLLRLRGEHRYAVIEMGANHPGEIAYVAGLAAPTVALVNNAGPAHLEGFGSLDGVAHAKGEIYQQLVPGGVAVINADDVYAPLWRELASACHQISFGMHAAAEVSAAADSIQLHVHNSSTVMRFVLRTPDGVIDIAMPLPGRHNVMNALAASAAALAAGAQLSDIKEGLEAMTPVAGRLHMRLGLRGAHVLDDTYNANPASLQAGLDVLAACRGEKWLVLGDMGELGSDSAGLHVEAGARAQAAGINRLFVIGTQSRGALSTFGDAQHFDSIDALIAVLRLAVHADVNVLVKGSRFMHMERVVDALLNGGNGATHSNGSAPRVSDSATGLA
ncbi:MAG: UDP-N-acetylmuramoyl-tripeptide--D-alanyl-D-alanine ligase [Gammaproteobacteria bacterium]